MGWGGGRGEGGRGGEGREGGEGRGGGGGKEEGRTILLAIVFDCPYPASTLAGLTSEILLSGQNPRRVLSSSSTKATSQLQQIGNTKLNQTTNSLVFFLTNSVIFLANSLIMDL